MKQKRHTLPLQEDEESLRDFVTSNDTERQLENREWMALVRTIASGLSEKQRLVFTLCQLEGLSSDEVEEITGLSATQVKRMEVFAFSVPYVLKMPGRVTDPGRGAITKDGSVCYPLTGDRLIPQDYVITATSRETCVWAWCISVLVLIVAIASFVSGRKKR